MLASHATCACIVMQVCFSYISLIPSVYHQKIKYMMKRLENWKQKVGSLVCLWLCGRICLCCVCASVCEKIEMFFHPWIYLWTLALAYVFSYMNGSTFPILMILCLSTYYKYRNADRSRQGNVWFNFGPSGNNNNKKQIPFWKYAGSSIYIYIPHNLVHNCPAVVLIHACFI